MKMKAKPILFAVFLVMIFVTGTRVTLALDGSQSGSMADYLSVYLDTNGNQTGTINAIGNYGSGEEFYIEPEPNTTLRLARLIVSISDSAIDNADEYGSITALSQGVSFWVEENGTRRRIDGGINTTTNGDYLKLMYDFNCDLSSLANGQDYCAGRWTFDKAGTKIRLDGNTDDKLIVMLNDSFVGLDEHYFLVQGYLETESSTTNELLTDLKGALTMISSAIIILGIVALLFWFSNSIDTEKEWGQGIKLLVNLVALIILVAGAGIGILQLQHLDLNKQANVMIGVYIALLFVVIPVFLIFLVMFIKQLMEFWDELRAGEKFD